MLKVSRLPDVFVLGSTCCTRAHEEDKCVPGIVSMVTR